jgi:hypothetical protein
MDVTFPEYQDASDFEPKAETPTEQEDVQTPKMANVSSTTMRNSLLAFRR